MGIPYLLVSKITCIEIRARGGSKHQSTTVGRAERICYLSVPSTRVTLCCKAKYFKVERVFTVTSSVATANYEYILFSTYFALPTLNSLLHYKVSLVT